MTVFNEAKKAAGKLFLWSMALATTGTIALIVMYFSIYLYSYTQ